ncbi:MAG: hypothetical protein ABJL72_10175 [Roseobacter sp.]
MSVGALVGVLAVLARGAAAVFGSAAMTAIVTTIEASLTKCLEARGFLVWMP